MAEQAALYRRWNPSELDEICGNAIAVAKCKTLIETPPSRRPGFYLFTGDTGTGKSTLAHLLFQKFGCEEVTVYNSRECGKVDFVTQFLADELTARSLFAKYRAFIFEEAHNITAQAQEMFMEPLEKGIPSDTFVAFVTNCPEKLVGGKGALLTRPFRIETIGVSPADMLPRLLHINANEPLGLSEEEVALCAKYSNRTPRVAINNMATIATLPIELRKQELERIAVIAETSVAEIPPNLRELAVAVEKRNWDTVAAQLRSLREAGDDPESLRRGLLAWYSGILVSDKPACRPKRAFARCVIDALRDNYYNTGFAGLIGDLSHIATNGIDN